MEIERKWLLRQVPMKRADARYWVDQFYLSTEPEIRLRRIDPMEIIQMAFHIALP